MKLKTKTLEKDNKTKSCFFKMINKIDKPLDMLYKKNSKKTQIINIRNQRGDITTDPTNIKREY